MSDSDWLSERYTTEGFERDQPPVQQVLNESWPAPAVARRLRDVEPERQIPVIARVELEHDGVQELAGVAVRWTRQQVCVQLADRRLLVPYVWLAASDVRRA